MIGIINFIAVRIRANDTLLSKYITVKINNNILGNEIYLGRINSNLKF